MLAKSQRIHCQTKRESAIQHTNTLTNPPHGMYGHANVACDLRYDVNSKQSTLERDVNKSTSRGDTFLSPALIIAVYLLFEGWIFDVEFIYCVGMQFGHGAINSPSTPVQHADHTITAAYYKRCSKHPLENSY